MAIVFLLGPGEWQDRQAGPSPMDQRRELAELLRSHHHSVILMEEEPEVEGEDMIGKFERLLRRPTDVVLYWPKRAKMSTTYDEMILILKASEAGPLPNLWFLHHEEVARIERGVFDVLESGGRSRYLTSLARLGIKPISWRTVDELRERTNLLGAQLG